MLSTDKDVLQKIRDSITLNDILAGYGITIKKDDETGKIKITSTGGGGSSLITVQYYSELPFIADLSELSDMQIGVVYDDEHVDDSDIIYRKGFYIYHLDTDTWTGFKDDEFNSIDITDVVVELWNNLNCTNNLDRAVTKSGLTKIMKSNNQKIQEKINNIFDPISFAECEQMIDPISKILKGEA